MPKKNGLEAQAGSSSEAPTESTPLIAAQPKPDAEGADPGQPASNVDEAGLSMKQTAFLVAGEMAGSGVLALPRALVKTGWVGVPIIVVMCAVAAFSGKRLGDCWSIIEGRDPEMRSRKRNPYAIIADQALGKTWSVVVSMAVTVTLFGAAVVYLLLASQIIEQVFRSLTPAVSYCAWYLIVAGAMTPLMLFRSPKDFPFTGVIAFASTVLACILYFIQMMNDVRPYTFRWGIHGFQDFFLAFGTIMFAFGGASTFPTIQNDMADKTKFGKSLQISFFAVLALYLPVAVAGYAVYGEQVAPNVAASLSNTPLKLVGNVLMALHLVAAFVILINPVCQEMEELYSVPRDSTGWRMAVRISIMLGIIFIGESIPRFDKILALVGGTTVALLTFILPSYCYLNLVKQSQGEEQKSVESPGWMKMVCWEVIVLGVVGGLAATYSAVSSIFSNYSTRPCYL